MSKGTSADVAANQRDSPWSRPVANPLAHELERFCCRCDRGEGKGLHRLPWRGRHSAIEDDAGDLGTECRLPVFPAPRLQERCTQERLDVADRRDPRAGGPAPACRIFLEAEMAQSTAAAGS